MFGTTKTYLFSKMILNFSTQLPKWTLYMVAMATLEKVSWISHVPKESKKELELNLLQYENQFIERVLLYTTLSTIWFCTRLRLCCALNPVQTWADLTILKPYSISQFSLLGLTKPCIKWQTGLERWGLHGRLLFFY